MTSARPAGPTGIAYRPTASTVVPLAIGTAVGIVLTVVAYLFRTPLYDFFDTLAAGSPPPLATVIQHAGDVGIIVLALLFLLATALSWRRDRRNLLLAIMTGAATVIAYALSELVKVLVSEERPCRVETNIHPLSPCPALGDWSWPSNHATIVAGLAVAIIFLVPRLWRLAVPIALIVALARVTEGVHYVHDVLSGLLLGTVLVALAGMLLTGTLARVEDRRRQGTEPLSR